MDFVNTLPQVVEGANAVAAINENFASASPAMVYAFDPANSAGLVFAYLGGRWGGNLIVGDSETLGASTTTYMVVAKADGAVSFSTSTTNWNDDTDYCRAYKITTGVSSITGFEDHRAGPGGSNFGGAAGGGGGTDYRNDVAALATSGSITIDYEDGDYFTLALSGNVTSISFSNLPGAGKAATILVQITQDSTPRTVAWPSSFKWAGGSPEAVSTGSGAIDFLAITTFDNGTTWRATLSKAFA